MGLMNYQQDVRKWPLRAVAIALGTATIVFSCSCAKKTTTAKVPAVPSTGETIGHPTAGAKLGWTEVSTPFPAANITAQGNVLWVCGANEMIASSSDGGQTWKLRHSRPDGKILLNIAFVDEKVGHAAGKDGVLLSTTDGGRTWKTHNSGDDVDAFSFADANNGIAVLGGDPDIVTYIPSWGGPTPSDGAVKLTHDGGDHWEEVTALTSDELKSFSRVLAVAALDSTDYLMVRRQPGIEDVFLVTHDAGKSWHVVHQRNDATNRELVRWVFVHGGEYWAFGMELVHRDTGGGYGVPLTLHSKDGETWVHGTSGPTEFGGCNRQGCYMWDGAVESLYGTHEQFWNLPQDSSLSIKWAIAGDRACTVSSVVECSQAAMTEKPQPTVPHAGGARFDLKEASVNLAFAEDCAACGVRPIWPDPGTNWTGRVNAVFSVDQSGTVFGVSLEGPLNARVRDLIEEQIRHWIFKPSPNDTSARRSISIDVKCVNVLDAPAVGGCRLAPARGPA